MQTIEILLCRLFTRFKQINKKKHLKVNANDINGIPIAPLAST